MSNGKNGSPLVSPTPAPSDGNYLFKNEDFDRAIWYTGDTATYYLTLTLLSDQDQLDLYNYVRANSEWNPAIYPRLNLTFIIPNGVNVYSSNTKLNPTDTLVPAFSALVRNGSPKAFGPAPALLVLRNTSTTAGSFNGFPTGTVINIINNGWIMGAHGVGGAGGTSQNSGTVNGSTGVRGGTAMYTDLPIRLTNTNLIFPGGGGGGGGAGLRWQAQATQTTNVCTVRTTYTLSGGRCDKRCGKDGPCPECASCNRSPCRTQAGMSCSNGVSCSGKYFFVKCNGPWYNPCTWLFFSYVPCRTNCSTSQTTSCVPNTQIVAGTQYLGTGQAGGIGFGTGNIGTNKGFYITDRSANGPWTFKTYTRWYTYNTTDANDPNNLNYNGNLINFIHKASGVLTGKEIEPRLLVSPPPNYGSDGGLGSYFGKPHELGDVEQGRGNQYYNATGTPVVGSDSAVGQGGAPGNAGYVVETTLPSSNITLINSGQMTEWAAFNSVGTIWSAV